MSWNMKAVEAPASAVKVALEDITEDVIKGVEEAFTYCQEHPTERLVVAWTKAEDRDETRVLIRSYCEARPAGRLTASLWNISVDPETGEKSGAEGAIPALSMQFTPYVKKSKK